MIKLKDILNEIEYDDGGPLSWIGDITYTWVHNHSIPFRAGSLEVVEWDEYPMGNAAWVYYVYQGESPFALNAESVNDKSETGLESTKKDGLIGKIVKLFKKASPSIIKKKGPIYPVIAIVTDNHYSDKLEKTVPTSIYIYVGTDTTKDWALPLRSKNFPYSQFGYNSPEPHKAENNVNVYAAEYIKDKYPRPEYFNDDLTDTQKKFIGDMAKALWEKPNRGITFGTWVIRKRLFGHDPDSYEDEYWDEIDPKSDRATKSSIGNTDPRWERGFWNMEKNQWGPYSEATRFNDRSIKSIEKARYVIKTKDEWEPVLISKG